MQDFINRLLDRTLGLSDVVQPLITPIFSDEIPSRNDLIMTSSRDELNPKPDKSVESFHHIENQLSTFKADPPFIDPESTKDINIEESMPLLNNVENPTIWEKLVDMKINKRSNTEIPNQAKEAENEKLVPKSEKKIIKNELYLDSNVKKVTPKHIQVNETPYLSKNSNLDNNKSSEVNGLSEKPFESILLKRKFPGVEDSQKPYSLIRLDSKRNFFNENSPMIKVTIGRIDVQAVLQHEQSPKRKETFTKPKLSLDEYLKQREGSQR